MGPTWGPTGSCRPQMYPMLVPWTLQSAPTKFQEYLRIYPVIWVCSRVYLTRELWQFIDLPNNGFALDAEVLISMSKAYREWVPAARSRYIAVIFLFITHKGRDMGCSSWIQTSPKFYYCNLCAVHTMVPSITAICRESIKLCLPVKLAVGAAYMF